MKFTRKLLFRLFQVSMSSILIKAEKSFSSKLSNENSSRISSGILSDYYETAGTIGIIRGSILMKNTAGFAFPLTVSPG